MLLKPEDISIGVTVFRRLEFLEQALTSAVNQTIPVKVHLHDDGCEDIGRLQRILSRFGGRVEYHRNPKTLGLFQNMNQCVWKSPTPWVSVLHDDDLLEKDFVEQILKVAPEVKNCALFCGGTTYIDKKGAPFFVKSPCAGQHWKYVPAEILAVENQFSFPGQLMHVATVLDVGGFPAKSIYTGDWELWFKLTLAGGTVQLGANLSFYRSHSGNDRGTTAASKSGRKVPDCAVQVKRNLARLRQGGHEPRFDRATWVSIYGPLYRDLLMYSWKMPSWLLSYNRRLLLIAKPRGRTSLILHWVSKFFGNPGIRLAGLARITAENLGYRMPQTF